MGGIRDWQDAVQFMLAGASAVGIGTALFVDPTIPLQVIDGLKDYLQRHSLKSASDLTGRLRERGDQSSVECA
jgi:dihydroorotate dehydrogenase (NAD+) catalytic subunit